MFIKSAVFALGITAAVASPLNRRQENITASAGASGVTTSLSATDTASAATSLSSALSSVVESASSGTASAPAPSATSNGPTSSNYTGCPDGYALSYAIGINTYPEVPIMQAYQVLSDWGNAIPPPIMAVSTQGQGVGATRQWMLDNITANEVLVNVTMNETSGFLDQQWNLTQPLNVSQSLIIANASSRLTLYANATTNETTVQFFVNFCVNNQTAGLQLYGTLAAGYLNGLNSLFSNSTATVTSSSSGSMTMSSSSAATDSAASSASGLTSSVASGASGATNTIASGVSGVTNTVGSGISGAASTALSGAGGVASTVAGGATSVFGQVTSAIIPTRRA